MLIGIFGPRCGGKSTLADALRAAFGGEIVTGKDYLRLAKSEGEALTRFKEKLAAAVNGDTVIYVITETDQVALLPAGAVRIRVTADLPTVKERFRARMHGTLPPPVEQMLERTHGMFDGEPADFTYDGVNGDAAALVAALTEQRG